MPIGDVRIELARWCADDLNSEGYSVFHLPRYVSKNYLLLSFKIATFFFLTVNVCLIRVDWVPRHESGCWQTERIRTLKREVLET